MRKDCKVQNILEKRSYKEALPEGADGIQAANVCSELNLNTKYKGEFGDENGRPEQME